MRTTTSLRLTHSTCPLTFASRCRADSDHQKVRCLIAEVISRRFACNQFEVNKDRVTFVRGMLIWEIARVNAETERERESEIKIEVDKGRKNERELKGERKRARKRTNKQKEIFQYFIHLFEYFEVTENTEKSLVCFFQIFLIILVLCFLLNTRKF